MSVNYPLHKAFEPDLAKIFEGVEFQPMNVTNGMVWRKARAVVGEDPDWERGETWRVMQEKTAVLTRQSRYETHDYLAIRRLSQPALSALYDLSTSELYYLPETRESVDTREFLIALNRGKAILKLFGEPHELSRDAILFDNDEDE